MKLNPSLSHHTLIGLMIGLWGMIFGYFIRPFEHGTMDEYKWVVVSLGFGSAITIAYIMVSIVQKWIYQKLSKWTNVLEVGIYVLFYIIYACITYPYYKSEIIRGFYSLPEFLSKIILLITIILTPAIYIARSYSLKLIPQRVESDDIIIKGNNKTDFLKIKKSELVCVSNAQNYVEIYYLENGELKTKLIRNSLKKIQEDIDFLIQVHRSHLINPTHFKSWKNSTTILLTQVELPVSKSYKNTLLNHEFRT